MKVLIVKREKTKNNEVKKLFNALDKKKISYEVIEFAYVDEYYMQIHKKDFKNSFDLLISLGGDGTILKSARIARKLDIPIFGINVGTVGFLTSVSDLNKIDTYIDNIIRKKYSVEERSMLSVEVIRLGKSDFIAYAVNEATFTTKNLRKIGKYSVSIGSESEFFNEYRADGLIVASPTGSTAHSFSVGGPIVAPDVNCFVMTAIYPHSLNQRSVIINGDSKIYVRIINSDQLLDVDGRITYDLMEDDIIKINKLKKTIKYITFSNSNFLINVRNKIKSI